MFSIRLLTSLANKEKFAGDTERRTAAYTASNVRIRVPDRRTNYLY
ncbi:hypothetical protein QBX69_01815 [Rickettsia rickettsii str. 'Sheila Smith']|nr:hypothetical protein [Rickettsia rickettsii]USD85761.1 hypothetical protein NDY50_01790 [Rickettsia rickettsii]WGQ95823.1 hypothetical protein QBX69_01815 [Rickettsia rickettsii str. 'Sheila Smith']